jgi:hypothetical protein
MSDDAIYSLEAHDNYGDASVYNDGIDDFGFYVKANGVWGHPDILIKLSNEEGGTNWQMPASSYYTVRTSWTFNGHYEEAHYYETNVAFIFQYTLSSSSGTVLTKTIEYSADTDWDDATVTHTLGGVSLSGFTYYYLNIEISCDAIRTYLHSDEASDFSGADYLCFNYASFSYYSSGGPF